jgi:YD repeat-containing protein
MPLKRVLLAALAVIFLFSCKKNNGDDSSGASVKLKLYIEDVKYAGQELTDSFNVTYDAGNRITSLSSPDLRFDYTYADNSFTLDLYENNALSIHEIAYINPASYVDSTFQFNNTNDTTTEGFSYSGSQLVHLITYSYSSAGTEVETVDDYAYDSNGNMVKDTQTDGSGNVNQISTFTYTNKLLKVTINPTYFAPASKYLPATESVSDGQGNTLGTVTYSYQFDGAGRLARETDTEDNGSIATKTYVYL